MKKFFIVFISFLFILAGCSYGNHSDSKIKIATTIYPLSDIARNIVKDKIEVVNIVKPGSSPHTFTVTPSDIIDLQGTKVIFQIGHGLDDWANDILNSLDGAYMMKVDKGIVLKAFTKNGAVNPHYWLSLSNAKQIARNMTDEIIKLDPNNKDFYEKNFNVYVDKLNDTDKEIRKILSDLPSNKIIVFHRSWDYFTNEYGLEVVGVFEPSPGQEPSIAHLQDLIKIAKKEGVKGIFSEEQLSGDVIKPFVEDLGIKLSVLDPLGGSEGRDSYIDLMLYNAKQIEKALR